MPAHPSECGFPPNIFLTKLIIVFSIILSAYIICATPSAFHLSLFLVHTVNLSYSKNFALCRLQIFLLSAYALFTWLVQHLDSVSDWFAVNKNLLGPLLGQSPRETPLLVYLGLISLLSFLKLGLTRKFTTRYLYLHPTISYASRTLNLAFLKKNTPILQVHTDSHYNQQQAHSPARSSPYIITSKTKLTKLFVTLSSEDYLILIFNNILIISSNWALVISFIFTCFAKANVIGLFYLLAAACFIVTKQSPSIALLNFLILISSLSIIFQLACYLPNPSVISEFDPAHRLASNSPDAAFLKTTSSTPTATLLDFLKWLHHVFKMPSFSQIIQLLLFYKEQLIQLPFWSPIQNDKCALVFELISLHALIHVKIILSFRILSKDSILSKFILGASYQYYTFSLLSISEKKTLCSPLSSQEHHQDGLGLGDSDLCAAREIRLRKIEKLETGLFSVYPYLIGLVCLVFGNINASLFSIGYILFGFYFLSKSDKFIRQYHASRRHLCYLAFYVYFKLIASIVWQFFSQTLIHWDQKTKLFMEVISFLSLDLPFNQSQYPYYNNPLSLTKSGSILPDCLILSITLVIYQSLHAMSTSILSSQFENDRALSLKRAIAFVTNIKKENLQIKIDIDRNNDQIQQRVDFLRERRRKKINQSPSNFYIFEHPEDLYPVHSQQISSSLTKDSENFIRPPLVPKPHRQKESDYRFDSDKKSQLGITKQLIRRPPLISSSPCSKDINLQYDQSIDHQQKNSPKFAQIPDPRSTTSTNTAHHQQHKQNPKYVYNSAYAQLLDGNWDPPMDYKHLYMSHHHSSSSIDQLRSAQNKKPVHSSAISSFRDLFVYAKNKLILFNNWMCYHFDKDSKHFLLLVDNGGRYYHSNDELLSSDPVLPPSSDVVEPHPPSTILHRTTSLDDFILEASALEAGSDRVRDTLETFPNEHQTLLRSPSSFRETRGASFYSPQQIVAAQKKKPQSRNLQQYRLSNKDRFILNQPGYTLVSLSGQLIQLDPKINFIDLLSKRTKPQGEHPHRLQDSFLNLSVSFFNWWQAHTLIGVLCCVVINQLVYMNLLTFAVPIIFFTYVLITRPWAGADFFTKLANYIMFIICLKYTLYLQVIASITEHSPFNLLLYIVGKRPGQTLFYFIIFDVILLISIVIHLHTLKRLGIHAPSQLTIFHQSLSIFLNPRESAIHLPGYAQYASQQQQHPTRVDAYLARPGIKRGGLFSPPLMSSSAMPNSTSGEREELGKITQHPKIRPKISLQRTMSAENLLKEPDSLSATLHRSLQHQSIPSLLNIEEGEDEFFLEEMGKKEGDKEYIGDDHQHESHDLYEHSARHIHATAPHSRVNSDLLPNMQPYQQDSQEQPKELLSMNQHESLSTFKGSTTNATTTTNNSITDNLYSDLPHRPHLLYAQADTQFGVEAARRLQMHTESFREEIHSNYFQLHQGSHMAKRTYQPAGWTKRMKEFVSQSIESVQPIDKYFAMLTADLLAFLVIVFFWPAFTLEYSRESLGDDNLPEVPLTQLSDNRIPVSFVMTLLGNFILVLVDRAIYLRKNLFEKYLLHIVITIGLHLYLLILFVLVPIIYDYHLSFFSKLSVGLWYFFKCIYLYYSSIQIQHGFPKFITHTFLNGNFTIINSGISAALRALPFFHELQIILDWTFTDTTLTLYEWFKLDYIVYALFSAKCYYNYLYYAENRRLGEKQGITSKITSGFFGLMGLLIILWLPMLLMSFTRYSAQHISPNIVSLSLLVDNQPLWQMTSYMSDTFTITSNQYNQLVQHHPNIRQYRQEDINTTYVKPSSSALWNTTPESRMDLIKNILNTKDSIPIELVIKVIRYASAFGNDQVNSQIRTSFIIHEPYQSKTRSELLKTLGDVPKKNVDDFMASQNIQTFPPTRLRGLLPKLLVVPRSGQLISFDNKTADLELVRKIAAPEVSSPTLNQRLSDQIVSAEEWWQLKQISPGAIEHDRFEKENFIQIVTLNDPIVVGQLSVLTNLGIIGIYLSVVLVAGKLLRGVFTNIIFELPYTDCVNPDLLLTLTNDIRVCRETKMLYLEELLYRHLINIVRRPDLMKEWVSIEYSFK